MMLRRFFLTTLFVSLSFVFTSTVSAQENTTDEPEIEYSVNVTADRLEEPLAEKSDSITVIEQDEIERYQWKFVSDVLRDVAGIAVVQSGSAGKTTSAYVRGSASEQLLILVDGVQVNDPYFGDVFLQDLTTDNVERIEIVRGPQSTLYGSDAIGGVIHIITTSGRGGFRPYASAEAGAFQTYREKAGISGGNNRADYAFSFARQDSDGRVENDELRENTVSGKATFRFTEATELTFTSRLHDSHIGIPLNTSYEPSLLRNQDEQLFLTSASLAHRSGDLLNLTTRFSATHIDFEFEDPEEPFFSHSLHTSNVLQASTQNDFFLGSRNVLSAGFEFESQRIDASDQNGPIEGLTDYQSESYSAFLQNKFENDRWILTAGIRTDSHSTFGTSTNPRISVAYIINSRWKIRGNVASGFRAPTAGDLLYPFYGNPDLRPEKSKSWEIGFDSSRVKDLQFTAVWFHNSYKDLITFDPNTFLAGNVAEARAQGLELAGSYKLQRWSISATYTYLDSKDEVENHRLVRRPTQSGGVRLSYDRDRWGSSIRILGVGNRLENDFRVFPTQLVINPGYARTDIAAYYKLTSSLKLQGRIENLFDAEYEEVLTFSAPGVAFYGGIGFSL